jgi:hypothetical protein
MWKHILVLSVLQSAYIVAAAADARMIELHRRDSPPGHITLDLDNITSNQHGSAIIEQLSARHRGALESTDPERRERLAQEFSRDVQSVLVMPPPVQLPTDNPVPEGSSLHYSSGEEEAHTGSVTTTIRSDPYVQRLERMLQLQNVELAALTQVNVRVQVRTEEERTLRMQADERHRCQVYHTIAGYVVAGIFGIVGIAGLAVAIVPLTHGC